MTEYPKMAPPDTLPPEAASRLGERRSRAALHRIAAGEQRKRATRIAEALHDGSFCLRYLPRLRLGAAGQTPAGLLEGAELWIGLPNRKRGLVAVAPFLRGLERQGPRADMLRFSLAAATAEVATWPGTWRVAVPVTGRTLTDGAVLDAVLEALDTASIAPWRIELQIDETELIDGGTPLNHTIGDLRAAGLGVTLDGFGATFGGLALLSRLPLSGLKLDRRLARVGEPDDDAADEATLIRASAEIAHRHGLTVTIDGIETEAELQRARRLGVDFVQGPWIGAAMPAETLRVRARSQG